MLVNTIENTSRDLDDAWVAYFEADHERSILESHATLWIWNDPNLKNERTRKAELDLWTRGARSLQPLPEDMPEVTKAALTFLYDATQKCHQLKREARRIEITLDALRAMLITEHGMSPTVRHTHTK